MLLIRQTETIDHQDQHDDLHTLIAYFTASIYVLVHDGIQQLLLMYVREKWNQTS